MYRLPHNSWPETSHSLQGWNPYRSKMLSLLNLTNWTIHKLFQIKPLFFQMDAHLWHDFKVSGGSPLIYSVFLLRRVLLSMKTSCYFSWNLYRIKSKAQAPLKYSLFFLWTQFCSFISCLEGKAIFRSSWNHFFHKNYSQYWLF